MGILNPDNLLNKCLSKIGDIILLNLLFILCSIPVITLGASLTALYYGCLRVIKGDSASVSKDFFHSFKTNFKQATSIWLCFVIMFIVLIFNIQFLTPLNNTLGIMLKYLSYGVTTLIAFEFLYIFPVLSAFSNTTGKLMKNAFLFTYMHLPSTLIMAVLWFIPFSLTMTDFKLAPLYLFCWFFIGFGLLAFICSRLFYRMFKKYLPQESLAE